MHITRSSSKSVASHFADMLSSGKGDYAAAAGELWHAAPAAQCK
jgi:hypothetical protein